ncbi:hypothetical protein AAIA72_00570 [Hahella sp. SMD15-11]|uniref:Lipoprotein n=1 Tax=Thermohahella caldifontis TaxID=3142973 RepID=A0AB39UX65_9GAMM
MKKAIALSALIATGALTGCSSLNVSSNSLPIQGAVSTDVKADIEVGQKISGTAKATKIFLFTLMDDKEFADGVSYGGASASSFSLGGLGPVEAVKSAAAYNAIQASGADVIVAPRYTIKKEDFGVYGTIEVTVEGYKGTIKSVK